MKIVVNKYIVFHKYPQLVLLSFQLLPNLLLPAREHPCGSFRKSLLVIFSAFLYPGTSFFPSLLNHHRMIERSFFFFQLLFWFLHCKFIILLSLTSNVLNEESVASLRNIVYRLCLSFWPLMASYDTLLESELRVLILSAASTWSVINFQNTQFILTNLGSFGHS